MKGLIGMDEIKEIAMRIKELREICDFSVEEVATKIGYDTKVGGILRAEITKERDL